jgi:hypothetical protein
MVFNATFNNVSAISWRSVLFVEETGVRGENNRPAAGHWQFCTSRPERDSNSQHQWSPLILVICTDCICSCKSNHHSITATTGPDYIGSCKSNHHTITATTGLDYQELILYGYMKNSKTINTSFINFLLSVARLTIYKSRQIMVFENRNWHKQTIFIYHAFTYYKMNSRLPVFIKCFDVHNSLIRFQNDSVELLL